ncbi:hypothetical protein [Streptomyces murinus]|uniref:hypothetical protein n=1 Tax=Streptomyces murinus TaxID=33900 RepID=UPI0037FB4D6C
MSAGTPERAIGGGTSAPSQVKRRGTVPPPWYAVLVTVRWWAAAGVVVSVLPLGEAAPVASPVPPPQPVAAIRTTAAVAKLSRMPAR